MLMEANMNSLLIFRVQRNVISFTFLHSFSVMICSV